MEPNENALEERMRFVLLLSEIDNLLDGLKMTRDDTPVSAFLDEVREISRKVRPLLIAETKALLAAPPTASSPEPSPDGLA